MRSPNDKFSISYRAPAIGNEPVALQREYYARTAECYDSMHEQMPHDIALGHVIGMITWLDARSVLDTGCGTGWGLRVIRAALPEVHVCGNDPSRALLNVAIDRYGVSPDLLNCAGSEQLPYDDGAFDVVVATGVMHHVSRPDQVVGEMLRVARQAVFISDANIYGGGSVPARVVKRLLANAGLLGLVTRLRRGGHEWYYSDGDGVAWSYSVYDSLDQVRTACADFLVIPTDRSDPRAAASPLRWSAHALLCGFKRPLPRPTIER